jgi:hypothetical protein
MGAGRRSWIGNRSPFARTSDCFYYSLLFRISASFGLQNGAHFAVRRGGTVNRPRTCLSHRKHKLGHTQGRNFPVHFQFPLYRAPRRYSSAAPWLSGRQSPGAWRRRTAPDSRDKPVGISGATTKSCNITPAPRVLLFSAPKLRPIESYWRSATRISAAHAANAI